jgi:Zinc finger, C2H2 type/C2H2-type zinc finger
LPSLTSTVHHTQSSPPTSVPQTVTTILQYSCSSCHEIFNTTDSLRQHLFQSHQILFPFTASTEHQYQQVQLPQTSVAQMTTTIQPVTQQFTTFTHKKYFDSEFPCMLCGVVSKNQEELIKHMINHTSTPVTSATTSSTIQKVTAIVERDRNSVDTSPTDLSSPHYK